MREEKFIRVVRQRSAFALQEFVSEVIEAAKEGYTTSDLIKDFACVRSFADFSINLVKITVDTVDGVEAPDSDNTSLEENPFEEEPIETDLGEAETVEATEEDVIIDEHNIMTDDIPLAEGASLDDIAVQFGIVRLAATEPSVLSSETEDTPDEDTAAGVDTIKAQHLEKLDTLSKKAPMLEFASEIGMEIPETLVQASAIKKYMKEQLNGE